MQKDAATTTEEVLEEQLDSADSCSISWILFIRKFRSEITNTPA